MRYLLASDDTEALAACMTSYVPERAACGAPGRAVSAIPFHFHEIVHATLPQGPAFLDEGLANMFDCRASVSTASVARTLTDVEMSTSSAFYSTGSYEAAASFVSFLLDEGGPEAMRDLLGDLSLESSLDEIDTAALRRYGRSMRSMRDDWSARPAEPGYAPCRFVFECGEPEYADGERLSLVRGVADVVSRGGVVRTFRVERESELRIQVRARAPRVHVGSCDRRAHPGDWHSTGSEVRFSTSAVPGTYYVWATGVIADPTQPETPAEILIEGL